MADHEHANGFQHLDLRLEGLEHEYDLGWKFDPNTDGPPGWASDPFLLLYISFRMTTGELRTSGTLRYALTRDRWRHAFEVDEEDRAYLRELALARMPDDLRAIDQGNDVAHLEEGRPLFLP